MIILCASTFTPRFGLQATTHDGIEGAWGMNYIANFHLLSILSPALRAQPSDREVRVIFTTCSSYVAGDITNLVGSWETVPKGKEYATSKLALMVFAQAFQQHLDVYRRPDTRPNNARVIIVDPGFTRTPGMRRWLSLGSLWGLGIYLCMWPFWWLVLKSPEQGAQSLLHAAMEAALGQGVGGRFIKECREKDFFRMEVQDQHISKKLWEFSEMQIAALEKESGLKRAAARKRREQVATQSTSHEKG
jgi:NAD(P)-dependent dehydrogenase (short-subunit alcohol dehydrogenase family)